MGYLDNSGLTHLWSKVKAALVGKQDKLTAGPGIKIEGNIISAEDFPAWVETELPFSGSWQSVTYGNGKFVAVANDDIKAAYSIDGITWTATNLPYSTYWRSVTYGNGKFVAVADYGTKAAYSEDGIIWIATTLPASESWRSVTYGNGKFVAVADSSNKAAYSIDGITWTATTLPDSAYWQSVTYGNGKFVAVADISNKAAYSIDGITWTATTLPASKSWQSVTYGNGKFVAVANDDIKAAYSIDGITWTATTLPNFTYCQSVTYGNGKFVAVAFYRTKAAYSEDGIIWIATTLPASESWRSVTYGNGKFVAVADSSNKAVYAAMTCVAGDGLSKYGDTLNVDNPVRGILTQAEFDALTEERKSSGTYIVDDGSVESPDGDSNWDVYSTQETRIGTYINGKPIYRLVVPGQTGTVNNAGVSLLDGFVSKYNVEWVIKTYGSVQAAYGWFNVPCSDVDWTMNFFVWNGDLNYKNVSSILNRAPFYCVVEYTKTTDPEVSA